MQINVGLIITFLLLLTTGTQNIAQKVQVSKDPLTKEQVAVYRAVLTDYLKEDKSPLNLNSETELFDRSRDSFDQGCAKGIDLETTPAPMIHELDRRVATSHGIVLVDAERQQKKIAENDPQNTIKKGVDSHEKVSEKQLKDSVTQAFSTGLFTFSEIAFDKQHRRAVVSYSFVCGGLCGQGRTVVLKNLGQTWKIINGCGGWIS
ncbi:MAG TPA: hypothetical protein VNY81_07335 [Candidatus Saccharimonadales bacterium]|jgi:hypothetical protein|nr:hypothetical protein [Candidatus Saccharimonadales bacterium]